MLEGPYFGACSLFLDSVHDHEIGRGYTSGTHQDQACASVLLVHPRSWRLFESWKALVRDRGVVRGRRACAPLRKPLRFRIYKWRIRDDSLHSRFRSGIDSEIATTHSELKR